MIRSEHLRAHPAVFRAMTGLTVPAFDQLVADLTATDREAEFARKDAIQNVIFK